MFKACGNGGSCGNGRQCMKLVSVWVQAGVTLNARNRKSSKSERHELGMGWWGEVKDHTQLLSEFRICWCRR